MTTDLELTKEQEALFQPGCFVVLHPESKHPDAGRVGKIISRNGRDMIVEFFNDDLVGRTEYSTIPLGHWGPVPEQKAKVVPFVATFAFSISRNHARPLSGTGCISFGMALL
jgi:hypothetical protein